MKFYHFQQPNFFTISAKEYLVKNKIENKNIFITLKNILLINIH